MYDLCVIGSGWAGFNAAVRAARLGAKACIIEKDAIGGVCLNRGCIPTKTLVKSSDLFYLFSQSAKFGINCTRPELNFVDIQLRKNRVIERLSSGIKYQLKNKNVDIINGEARLISPNEISVGQQKIESKNIILATGSRPIELPSLKFDHQRILSSDDILEIGYVPKNLLIVGGGVIGCEFASIFKKLGSKVTIVELLDSILPAEDAEVAKALHNLFKKKGITVLTKATAESLGLDKFDVILVSVGRLPNIEGLGLEQLGVKKEKKGIIVNEYLQTGVENIYAVGDCTGGILLAHVAAYEGILAAENIFKKQKPVDYYGIPNCIFTDPEIASVGLTEAVAISKGHKIKVLRFNFLGCGMAHILDETDGFIKILVDEKSEEIIGASIIGPKATELITVLTIIVRNRIKISQINDPVIAHPTLSESIFEAIREYNSIST